MHNAALRILEFLILFGVIPTVFAFTRHRLPAIPSLWGMTVFCLALLWRDPSFDRSLLWRARELPQFLPEILGTFAIVAIGLTLVVWRFAPQLLFRLPRTNPALWVMILVLYPVLSVYPQSIVFRAFLFHRYAALFGSGVPLIVASAAAFGYVHVIFRNRWAVGLSGVAGILFAWRYSETGSLFVGSFEHALYGCLAFTVGLGQFFLHRVVRENQEREAAAVTTGAR